MKMGRARRENGGGERKCKLRQGKVFVDGGGGGRCRERRYADHIFI